MAVTAAALAEALGLSLGTVRAVIPTAAGDGYKASVGAAVTVGAPPAGDGHRTAIVRAVLLYGDTGRTTPINFYEIIDAGAGYVTAPPVTVAAPPADSDPRVQATAVATVDSVTDATALLARAVALVDAYLRGGTAPDAIRDEAIIRTAGHVNERRGYGTVEGAIQLGHGAVRGMMTPVATNPVRQSGAGAILAPYVRRTA